MTDRRARCIALAMYLVSWTCVGLDWRLAFAGPTLFYRAAGGVALAINAAAVVANALAYLMHCPGGVIDAAAERGRSCEFKSRRHRWGRGPFSRERPAGRVD